MSEINPPEGTPLFEQRARERAGAAAHASKPGPSGAVARGLPVIDAIRAWVEAEENHGTRPTDMALALGRIFGFVVGEYCLSFKPRGGSRLGSVVIGELTRHATGMLTGDIPLVGVRVLKDGSQQEVTSEGILARNKEEGDDGEA